MSEAVVEPVQAVTDQGKAASAEPGLISVVNLYKTYRMGRVLVPVIKGATLDIKAGEWLAVLGASGSGKSTLLHILGDLDQADEDGGEVIVHGRRLATFSRFERNEYRNRFVGFVFQFYHLLPELNVLENTLLAGLVGESLRSPRYWAAVGGLGAGIGIAISSLLPLVFFDAMSWQLQAVLAAAGAVAGALLTGAVWTEIRTLASRLSPRRTLLRRRATQLLESLGLGHRLKHRPRELSGGESQRVAIARALINEPRILFADEPTGNLDEKTGAEILDLIAEQHRRGLTIVMVTHDPAVATRATRTIRLHDGQIKE